MGYGIDYYRLCFQLFNKARFNKTIQNMVKSGKINWKSVHFNDPSLSSEGLIAFEECTDYNFIQNMKTPPGSKRKIDSTVKKSKKKRKVSRPGSENSQILSPSKQGSSVHTHVEFSENNDDSNEITAWSNFGLPQPILKALQEEGFTEPTQIQALTLPAAVLGRRDIIGAAETGSGKTLAFGLPILAGIYNEKGKSTEKPLYALILTPTRELAMQIKNHLKAAAKYTDINIAVVVGGMAAVKQERILGKGPEIVVATPGRLWELIQQGNCHLSKISEIRFLVIDETDRMLEKGHFEELHDLLEKLNSNESKRRMRQNFVFSATLTLVHELPKYLMTKLKKSKTKMTSEQKLQKIIVSLGITTPKIVDITQGGGTSKTLTESRITCGIEEKDYYVYYFLQKHPGRTLIFCNSIGCVRRLTNLLNVLQCSPLPLHASMQQRQRLKNLEKFMNDEKGILVATDVAARGLDIPKVEHVIHYQTPRTSESYVHRSGRTARASQEGITVLLSEPAEIHNYVKLCKTLGKSEDLPVFPVEETYLNAIKQRVNLARDLDKLNLEVRKGSSEVGWLQKAAEEMDIIIDDFNVRYDKSTMASQKKFADVKRKQLIALLAKPVFPKGFSGKYALNSSDFSEVFCGKNNKTALEAVKAAISNNAKEKRIPLFKPNKVAAKQSKMPRKKKA